MNHLYYGDNLEVLRRYIKDESVDLCYIDPPFNSKRNYNQIYNNIGLEDKAQAQAFIDTWEWNSLADEGFIQIMDNYQGRFTAQTIALIAGLKEVLGKGSLLAYLISITLRTVEIHRVLKSNGSFYLHCDPTSSHYLKLIIDTIFCAFNGEFKNELIWYYGAKATQNESIFQKKHDIILFYSKSHKYTFNTQLQDYSEGSLIERDTRYKLEDEKGRYRLTTRRNKDGSKYRAKVYLREGVAMTDVWLLGVINATSKERLGYPTQKPEALLERIIQASSNEGNIVLDAYCGCGTTVAVAQRLNRQWIGVDITYQSISLILKRLEDSCGNAVLNQIKVNGIPKDIKSAEALANCKDDRTRKEFEKWSILTYSNNRAIINQKKGADKGIDGFAFFLEEGGGNKRIVFQVKSGNVKSGDIRELYGTVTRESAAMGIFITLKPPTAEMMKEANACGFYHHKVMGRSYSCIQIVTIKDMLENGKRLDIPLNLEVLKTAERKTAEDTVEQLTIPFSGLDNDLKAV